MVLLSSGILGISTLYAGATPETPCSPPVAMGGNDRFLVERCDGGSYVIDTVDGSRSWVSSGEVTKACDENGQCIQVSG
ncbi:MAG: hypothetical protein GEU26_18890 [Nitrososphaeraceae archaeon]|nr:hypothetical protein [Nitrososphaeraceae archaeon]